MAEESVNDNDEDEQDEEPSEEDEEELDVDDDEDYSSRDKLSQTFRKTRKQVLKKESGKIATSANRALRIKMGKSGAEAASRKSNKHGKEVCQRKLWNQMVSVISKFQIFDLFRRTMQL